jgi:hypothetical protein
MSSCVMVLGSLLVLFLLSIFLPFPLRFRLVFGKGVAGKIYIAGILPIGFGKRPSLKKKHKARGAGKGISLKRISGKSFRLLLDSDFVKRAVRAIFRLSKRMLSAFSIHLRRADIIYGAGDPYRTAMVMGRYYSALYSIPLLRGGERIGLRPDFTKRRLEGSLDAFVNVFVGRILVYLFLFLVEWPLAKTWSHLRRD